MGEASGSQRLYYLEGRTMGPKPVEHASMLLDGEWRRIEFDVVPIPVSRTVNPMAREMGLLNYEAARALAFWWLSLPSRGLRRLMPESSLQVRLVQVTFIYKWEYKANRVGHPIDSQGEYKTEEWKDYDSQRTTTEHQQLHGPETGSGVGDGGRKDV